MKDQKQLLRRVKRVGMFQAKTASCTNPMTPGKELGIFGHGVCRDARSRGGKGD